MSVEAPTEPKSFDLLLRGGRVIDPANGRDALLDVAIAGQKIAAVAAGIPADSAKQVVDVTGHTVKRGGEVLSLTPLEFDLLVCLARKPGQVFTREVLPATTPGLPYSPRREP